MNILINTIIVGKLIKRNNSLYLVGKSLDDQILELMIKNNINLDEFKNFILSLYENIEYGNKIYNNIIDGNQHIIIKKIENNSFELNKENIEIYENNSLILNMDIKQKINNKFKSTTIYDLINQKTEYDYSISIDNINNIDNLNNIFKIIENNLEINKTIKPFYIAIKELHFLKNININNYKHLNIHSVQELKELANKIGYEETIKKIKNNENLIEKSKLIDLFLKYKKELENNNFNIIDEIKKTINQYELINCPIYLNYKIKINNNNIDNFNTFILNNIYNLIYTYYNSIDNEFKYKIGYIDNNNKLIINNNILDRLYLNNLIFSIRLQKDNNGFKITRIYGYNRDNRKFIKNLSHFGLISNIINQLNTIIKE